MLQVDLVQLAVGALGFLTWKVAVVAEALVPKEAEAE